jgi:hypothetical protein
VANDNVCGGAAVSAAYGARIASELPGSLLALSGADHWPSLDVVLEPDPEPSPAEHVFVTYAGPVCLSKDLDRVRLPVRGPCDVDLAVHPLLSTAAWMRARFLGLEIVHAGAVLTRQGAWLVLADKEGGKSTLLARLHAEGFPIVADDMAILDMGRVYAGPRCLDLRPDMGRALGMGRTVRNAERRRVDLPPIAAEHQVAGILELRWSDQSDLSLVEPVERLTRLIEASGRRPRRDPLELLELATLPFYLVERPRESNDTAAQLLEGILRGDLPGLDTRRG